MKRGSTRDSELFRNNDASSCDSIILFFVSHGNSLGYITCTLNYNVIHSFSALNVRMWPLTLFPQTTGLKKSRRKVPCSLSNNSNFWAKETNIIRMEKLQLKLLLDFELKKPRRKENPGQIFVHFEIKKGIGGTESKQKEPYMDRVSEKWLSHLYISSFPLQVDQR